MVCASNGGVIAAAIDALRTRCVSGSLSSGLHHARRARGAGFCTFNGLVLAARAALDAGARTVLILDLDAHCGGGTHELIRDDERIWQMDVSVDAFDRYEPLGNNKLEMVHDASRYLPTIERILTWLEREAPRFDICLYNACDHISDDVRMHTPKRPIYFNIPVVAVWRIADQCVDAEKTSEAALVGTAGRQALSLV